MRYTLESALPLGAFKPRGGLFAGGMTLHGGGGGFIEDIGNSIGDAFSGVGDALGGAVEGIGDFGQSVANVVSDAGVAVDNAVGDYVPGGWTTVAAVALPFAAPSLGVAAGLLEAGTTALTAGQAAALSSGVSAASSAIKGKSLEETLKDAAIAGATSYGLSSLGGAGTDTPNFNDAGAGSSAYGEANELFSPSSLESTLKSTIDAVPTPIVSPEAASNFAANADDIYTDQIIDSFQKAQASDLPAFESTAQRIGSDAPTPDLVPRNTDQLYTPNFNDAGAGSTEYGEANDLLTNNPVAPDPFKNPNAPSFFDRIVNAPGQAYDYLTDPNRTISDMGSDLYESVKANPLEYGLGALGVAGLAGEGPLGGIGQKIGTAKLLGGSTPSTQSGSSAASKAAMAEKDYKYGSAGVLDPNYLLRNRINAGNVYSSATGYQPISTRYAEGGEVQHFGMGGLSNALTNVFQPIEKSVVQPIGQAAPFLRDALPYAGMIAAPFIASPVAAAGVGALASGMGKGGFNMKRALMGGISAYGMSNLGAGLEAAGGAEPSGDFFRSPEPMTKGLENLTAGGNSYDTAAKAFGTKAGLPSAGMAIMGQSGVSAVNEGIDQQAAADQAMAQSNAAQNETDARNQSARERAFAAIRANPYQYAVGGSIDDEYGMDEARGLNQGNLQNGFMGGVPSYAAGGTPRFLSGGGDGMSDSIPATINGSQEARLADGEFVIPADVVSHLGNGSSKAGAKQLYSMMDRVRQARVGNKQQGKQINPRKLMTA
jgi:hypothetical protein